jgi:23S rRNA (adenine2503-C2)-methyltransferase
MPVNRKYPLAELIAAVAEHTRATGRIVTFEYTLIKEVNDSAAQAHALARLLARLQCRVNLIPLSPVEEFDGQRSAPAAARVFIETLCKAGINATLRDSKGGALKAACGQLRYGGKHG